MSINQNGIIDFNLIDESSPYMKMKRLEDDSTWGRINWLDVSNGEGYFANATEVNACYNKNNRFSAMGIVDKFKSGSLLGTEYTRLDFIQSTGSQYIDTGYAWTSENVEIFLDAIVTTAKGSTSLFGAEEYTASSGNARYFSGIPHGGNGAYSFYIGTGAIGSISFTETTRFRLGVKIEGGKAKVILNGATQFEATYSGSIQAKKGAYLTSSASTNIGHIFLFSNHNSNRGSSNAATQQVGGMKVYAFRLHENGKLVRDFVPCKNSSGTVGMFDLVEGIFYTTPVGAFTAGNTVSDGGSYEFMLTYPKISDTMYNRWRQTNSPNASAGTGYEQIKIDYDVGTQAGPLILSSSSYTSSTKYACGASGWWGPVGQYVAHQGGIPAVGTNNSITTETELWIRLDYIFGKGTDSDNTTLDRNIREIYSALKGGDIIQARIIDNQTIESAEFIEF